MSGWEAALARACLLPQSRGDADGKGETGRKGKLKKKEEEERNRKKKEAFIARDHTPETCEVCL